MFDSSASCVHGLVVAWSLRQKTNRLAVTADCTVKRKSIQGGDVIFTQSTF